MNTQEITPIEEVREICEEFTKGILDGRSSKDMCWVVSNPLSAYLGFLGIPNRLTEGTVNGWHHWWIEVLENQRGVLYIIDATADQFNEREGKNMPQVYVGEYLDWYSPDYD